MVRKNRPQVGQVLTFILPEEYPSNRKFVESQRRKLAGTITVSKIVEAPNIEHGFLMAIAVNNSLVKKIPPPENEASLFSPGWFHYDGE